MNNVKKMVVAAVLMGAFLATGSVYAQEGSKKAWEGRGKKIQEVYNQLNLTDDQKKQLEANKRKQREQMKGAFEKVRSNREALTQELMKPELDMNKINGIQGDLKGLQSEMADSHLNSILEVRKILTPEQFAKFIQLTKRDKHERGEK